jgi:molybdate transport system substrate-binding protein
MANFANKPLDLAILNLRLYGYSRITTLLALKSFAHGLIAIVLAINFTQATASPAIAAASDLQFALTEIAEKFELKTQHQLRLSFGSSGNFQRQILQGAPFELFLSADEAYVKALFDAGVTRDEGLLYAYGRIVLILPNSADIRADIELTDLGRALEDGRLKRFAIANPEHAPYGRAARQALQRAGRWKDIKPHLVLGENAAQAARFATSGSTQGGIIPHSLARVQAVNQGTKVLLLPASLHDPLRQRMVLMRHAGPIAEAFYLYIQSPEVRKILTHHGFELRDD